MRNSESCCCRNRKIVAV